jgi:4-hydroxybenzoyl-CoA thioesterase
MSVPRKGISPLKLRLKPVRIGPIPGGSGNLTSYAQAGFSPARPQAASKEPGPGMANLVYRRQFTVEWGHCDPAGIVFNSRFFEFFDWSAWRLFETALNVRPNELASVFGIVGIPLVDAKARFVKPAKFNDVADIASEVSEFKRSSFEVAHRISIDGELAVEGSETRVWAGRDPDDPAKMKGVPIPAAVIARFRAPA